MSLITENLHTFSLKRVYFEEQLFKVDQTSLFETVEDV